MNSTPRLPTGGAKTVARGRLLNQLLEARRKRCIAMQGPAGSGKTTLLLAWRESLLSLGFHVAWHAFTEDDDNLPTALDHLVASLAAVDARISTEASQLLNGSLDGDDPEGVVISLIRGIEAHHAELVLVLDDVQHLSSPIAHEALQWLIEYAPSNLHIVLASRNAIPLSLGRLRDQGLTLELDMRDLRFTAAESLEFLRSRFADFGVRDAQRLHELTDGWVAGLQLFALQFKRGTSKGAVVDDADGIRQTYLLDAQALGSYFEREVLAQLADAEVDLLIRFSACSRLCPSLCLALIDQRQPTAEALGLLAKLEGDNLFVRPAPQNGAQTWYSLNPLFRETLLRRFHAHDEHYQCEVHRIAWRWFEAHEDTENAVRHALMAGEINAAVVLVQSAARGMRLQGQFHKLAGLMRLLPPAEIEAHVDLRLWMIMRHLYARDLDACAAAIDKLDPVISNQNAKTRYRLILMKVALAVQRDNPSTAEKLLPLLLDSPEGSDELMLGARNNLVSWLHLHQGNYAQARQIHIDAPKPFGDDGELLGTSAGTLNGRCLVALSHAIEGRFVQAERQCRDVLFEANQRGPVAHEASCFASALLGEILYESNDLVAARALLEDQVDVLERMSVPDSVLRLFSSLSAIHWAAGHRQEAFAHIKRLEDYATRHGSLRILVHVLATQAQYHLQMSLVEEARSDLKRLDDLTDGGAIPVMLVDEVRLTRDQAQLRWDLFHGDEAHAEALLRSLIATCERRGWQRPLLKCQLQLALLDRHRGDKGPAETAILEILRRGNRLGLVRSLLDTSPEALDVIVEVMQKQPHEPVLTFYLARLQAAQHPRVHPPTRPASRALPPGTDQLSEREAKVMHLLAQALPNKKIARTMGISPETVKWHLKNIYGKLGVSSRDEAVARVRDLALDAKHAEDDRAH